MSTSKTSFPDTEIFSIEGQALKLTTREDIQPYLEKLSKLDKVSKLDLSGNTIGTEASEALASAIESNPKIHENLQEVNFADLYTSRLVDEVVASLHCLLPALLKCPRLHTVNLSDNAFGLRTINSLESFIASAVPLRHLILSNNGMGPFAGARIGKALLKLAQLKQGKNNGKDGSEVPLLETFVCGRNRLENHSSLNLALGLKAHGSSLKCVRLYQNGIRPAGIFNLLQLGLKYNTQLETLDLQDNTFTRTAAVELADVLPVWRDSLVELNVNDCILKKSGSDAVLDVFTKVKFSKLASLKLEYNELVQQTVEEKLLAAIEAGNLPALKELQINGNILDEESKAIESLQEIFEDLELDDLEEPDSEDEEDEEDEDAAEREIAEIKKRRELDIESLERELLEIPIEELTEALAKTTI